MGPFLTKQGLANLIDNILIVKRIQVLRIYFNARFFYFWRKFIQKNKITRKEKSADLENEYKNILLARFPDLKQFSITVNLTDKYQKC